MYVIALALSSVLLSLSSMDKKIYLFKCANYPRATRCGGDIVTLLLFRPCVCVRVSVTL